VLDWMRPEAERTHLGVFVQRVVDGSAGETVVRKLGYAAETVTGGWIAVLTLLVVIAVVVVVWPRSRVRVPAWDLVEREWPLSRPVVVGLLIAGIAGGLVNDYGVRIATVMLVAAVPLLGMVGLRAASVPEAEPAARPDGYPASTPPT
jgi:hypothetical protein